MQSGVEQLFLATVQKRSVGCNDRAIAALACHMKKFGQQGVRQRLAHEVIVKILGIARQSIEHEGKFRAAHLSWCSMVSVTKGAALIAQIGDFYVCLTVHGVSFF